MSSTSDIELSEGVSKNSAIVKDIDETKSLWKIVAGIVAVLALAGLIVGLVFAFQPKNSSNGLVLAPIVKIAVGSVQGITRTFSSTNTYTSTTSYTVNEYRGIPYALPTSGNRRFALPEAVTSLGSGVFQAYNFGPVCPQKGRPDAKEDCLSINVSVPAGTKAGDNLPVFFWIYGGRFLTGSSDTYRLDRFAGEGKLVAVSINYRLGAFGFMPNAAFEVKTADGRVYNGNYGLEDQRLAMKWVQDNIAAFGGDKTKVTIGGESAGAGSVCMHLLAPTQVNGLFSKGIIESAGCAVNLPTVTEAQAPGKASQYIQNGLGCNSDTLACMRSKSIDQILEQQNAYMASKPGDITAISPVYGDPNANPPLVATTVPQSFRNAAIRNALYTVPLLMGGNQFEMRLFAGYFWQESPLPINSTTIDSYYLPLMYPGTPSGSSTPYATTVSQYSSYKSGLHSSDPRLVAQTFGRVMSNYNPAVGISICLFLQTANLILDYVARNPSVSMPLYQYVFADTTNVLNCGMLFAPPCPNFIMGAIHASELNYLFPNLDYTAAINGPNLPAPSQNLGNQMMAYWTNFVRSGNPNSATVPTWPLYEGSRTSTVQTLIPDAVEPLNWGNTCECESFWAPLFNLTNTLP